jgi:DNA-binding transcriptional MerR regulator
MAGLRIGALASRSGINTPTIRYYEEIGLLPRAHRLPGGQRIYGEEDARRLTFIRRCRNFGFSIDRVRALVSLVQDRQRSCFHARDLANDHLAEVQSKLKELRALERSIAKFVADCDSLCAGGAGSDCSILQDLSRTPGRTVPKTSPRS